MIKRNSSENTFRRFSITDKLVIASLALSIITITIVASYSFTNAKKAILDRTFNQLTSVRVIRANLLDKFFSNCVKEIQMARATRDFETEAKPNIQILVSSRAAPKSAFFFIPPKANFVAINPISL